MKLIISGGRSVVLNKNGILYLDDFFRENSVDIVLNGDCPTGVDKSVRDYCRIREIKIKLYPAKWDDLTTKPVSIKYNKYGKPYNSLSGFNRNLAMAKAAQPDGICVCMPGSRGTNHMADMAIKCGITLVDLRKRFDLVED